MNLKNQAPDILKILKLEIEEASRKNQTSPQSGRPREYEAEAKIKTTITFERKHIIALDAACIKYLEAMGKSINRGDIIRYLIENHLNTYSPSKVLKKL